MLGAFALLLLLSEDSDELELDESESVDELQDGEEFPFLPTRFPAFDIVRAIVLFGCITVAGRISPISGNLFLIIVGIDSSCKGDYRFG